VFPHNLARNLIEFQGLSDLICVSRRDDNFISSGSKFVNDWTKKWNVRRIVQIDPNLSLPHVSLASRAIGTAADLD